MPRRATPQRSPWEDRFTTPTPDGLLSAFDEDTAAQVSRLRQALTEEFELSERLEWCGLPWKWSLTYRLDPGDADILAYVVPNPEAPAVVFRLTHEQFTSLPVRKLSRHIRDGLAPTRLVAGVCWPEWKVQTASQAQDIIDLFSMLHALTSSES